MKELLAKEEPEDKIERIRWFADAKDLHSGQKRLAELKIPAADEIERNNETRKLLDEMRNAIDNPDAFERLRSRINWLNSRDRDKVKVSEFRIVSDEEKEKEKLEKNFEAFIRKKIRENVAEGKAANDGIHLPTRLWNQVANEVRAAQLQVAQQRQWPIVAHRVTKQREPREGHQEVLSGKPKHN